MNISIHQKRFTLSYLFKITINNQINWSAKRKLFSNKMSIKDDNQQVIATIKDKWALRQITKSKVTFMDKSALSFHTKSHLKGAWELSNKTEQYHLYEHEGYDFSIYHNNQQVASCKKNEFVFLGKDKYEIYANDDINIPKTIALILLLDAHLFMNRDNRFLFRRKIFGDVKPKNWHWRPNKTQ